MKRPRGDCQSQVSTFAYKLFRVRVDGSLGSLFINARDRLKTGKWLAAGFYPKKGFKARKGWHCVPSKRAPHLSKKKRIWKKVEIKNYTTLIKPKNQGGKWYLAREMRILN